MRCDFPCDCFFHSTMKVAAAVAARPSRASRKPSSCSPELAIVSGERPEADRLCGAPGRRPGGKWDDDDDGDDGGNEEEANERYALPLNRGRVHEFAPPHAGMAGISRDTTSKSLRVFFFFFYH